MPNDTAPAWPDPERPGVPLNPEKDGAHWIIGWNNSPFVAEWQADPNAEFGGDYGWYDGGDRPDGIIANGWTYGGPCLTPSEAQAREAAAWAAGAAAMKEAAAADVDWTVRTLEKGQGRLWQDMAAAFSPQADEIRALPLPPMPTN